MPEDTVERFCGYPLFTRRVTVAGRTFELIGPANYEKLLDDPRVIERFRQDEYMPYWAEFWPAARLLAEEIVSWGPVAGAGTWERGNAETKQAATSSTFPSLSNPASASTPPTVLELGCGLGLVGLVAHALGYPTIISDYDQDALAFITENARRNGLPPPATRFLDWRQTYADLRVDRILGADILYETRHLHPIVEFIYNHLNPGGFALLGDMNRTVADWFAEAAKAGGLSVETVPIEMSIAERPQPLRGRLFRLQHLQTARS